MRSVLLVFFFLVNALSEVTWKRASWCLFNNRRVVSLGQSRLFLQVAHK